MRGEILPCACLFLDRAVLMVKRRTVAVALVVVCILGFTSGAYSEVVDYDLVIAKEEVNITGRTVPASSRCPR